MSNWQSGKDHLSELISSFPLEIQRLLGNLNSKTRDSHSFERIFEEKTEICWTTFVNNLRQDFPIVIDDVLYFKPKLLLFPLHLQRNILSVLLVCRSVPIDSLRKLVETLDRCKEQVDGGHGSWTETLHKLLIVKIAQLQNENFHKKSTVFHVDTITEKSRPQFQELCAKIKSLESVHNIENTCTSNISWTLIESANQKAHCTSKEKCSLELVPDGNDEYVKLTPMDIDEQITDPCEVMQTACTDMEEHIKMGSPLLDEPPSEFKINDSVDEVLSTTYDLHSKCKHLQEMIQYLSSETSKIDSGLQHELQIFNELSASEMEEACNYLGLNNLQNDNVVAVLIQAFLKINPEPSYQNTNIFALKVILPYIQQRACPISRILANSMMMFCEKFSSITCASLLYELLINPLLNPFQADFICKVIGEKLNAISNNKLLSMFLDSDAGGLCYWNDNIVSVVQALIDSNVMLEQEILQTKFVDALKRNAINMPKSLQFIKLVVSIIRKYGSLVSANKQSFVTILEKNETFLKRAGMISLKKIN